MTFSPGRGGIRDWRRRLARFSLRASIKGSRHQMVDHVFQTDVGTWADFQSRVDTDDVDRHNKGAFSPSQVATYGFLQLQDEVRKQVLLTDVMDAVIRLDIVDIRRSR